MFRGPIQFFGDHENSKLSAKYFRVKILLWWEKILSW